MNNELISVIVPVYNVERYLSRCMKTLLAQTCSDYEILLIDDGSKDRSGLLCDKYAKKYDRVTAYHKQNGGLGSARNYGIERANGKYICFVDSDDKVEADHLSVLYRALVENNADISISGYNYSSGSGCLPYRFADGCVGIRKVLRDYACGNAFYHYACFKLYKKELIDKMPMLFSDRHCAEDMYFNSIYYRYVSKVATVEKPLYTYYVNLGSLSNVRREGFWEDMLLVYDAFKETCRVKGVAQEYAGNLLVVLLRNSISNFFNSETTQKQCERYIKHCVSKVEFGDLSLREDKLGKVDRLVLNAVKNGNYATVCAYMRAIKWIKVKHFKTFNRIRMTVFNRK